jgi:hypothetical protein
MNIKTVVLKSGLELVADVEEIKDHFSGKVARYRLKKPFVMHIAAIPLQTPQGINIQMTPALIPFLQTTNASSIEFEAHDVLPLLDPSPGIYADYVKQTTGFQLASSVR